MKLLKSLLFRRMFLSSIFIFQIYSASAQETATVPIPESKSKDIYDLNLEELMEVSVATLEPVKESKAPGIITVISRDRIKNSGARNLVDILNMVPGFQFAVDYDGTLGLGVRGLWALEGKVLFMIDGLEMNDIYYNSYVFMAGFPVEQISRVEIVRGPGSVIYGGSAEYAVINVITLNGEELKGLQAGAQFGLMREGVGRDALYQAFGNKSEDWQYSLKLFGSRAVVSDGERTYPDGSRFSGDDYGQNIKMLNLGINYKNFGFKFISDNNRIHSRDAYGTALVEKTEVGFYTHTAQLEYQIKPSEKFSLTPTYVYKRSVPYHNSDPELGTTDGGDGSTDYHFDYSFNRHRYFLPALWKITDDLKLLMGVEYNRDEGKTTSGDFYRDPLHPTVTSKTRSLEYAAGFSELTYDMGLLGAFSAGGRYETHSLFSDRFVPRFAWTDEIGNFAFKLLYSQAYRNPSIGNLDFAHAAGNEVDAEKTNVKEVSASYKFSSNVLASLNYFDILSKETIVYNPVTFGYSNGEQTGSRGAEFILRQNAGWGFAGLGLSFYDGSMNRVDRYAVTEDESALAGFSNFKATLNSKYSFNDHWSIRPKIIYLGERYGFSGDIDGDGSLEARKFDPSLVTHLFLSYENLITKGLDVTFGVANLFDSDNEYLTAYDLGRNEMPGPTREFLINLDYSVTTF